MRQPLGWLDLNLTWLRLWSLWCNMAADIRCTLTMEKRSFMLTIGLYFLKLAHPQTWRKSATGWRFWLGRKQRFLTELLGTSFSAAPRFRAQKEFLDPIYYGILQPQMGPHILEDLGPHKIWCQWTRISPPSPQKKEAVDIRRPLGSRIIGQVFSGKLT